MRSKLFKRYFLTTASIIIFSLAIMMLILSFVLNNYIAESRNDTLNLACEEVSDYLSISEAEDRKIEKADIDAILSSISNVSQADVFITDVNGKVIACSCNNTSDDSKCIHFSVSIKKDELNKNLETPNQMRLTTLGIYSSKHYVSAKEIHNTSNKHYASVFTVAPVSSVSVLLTTVSKLFIASILFPLIMMFISIYAMTYRLTKPLKLMSEASKAMAKGDFSKRIPVITDDEIGELSVSFNMMTNSLSRLEGMRKSFVANVSHELKTPMTTIGGFIDGILDGTIDPEKQSYYLEIVSNEVKRLSRLVESMLSMSKLESGEFALKPELFDFSELLCKIVISQEQRIESKGLSIVGLDTLDNISINADSDLIHQALYNLVDNAIKFTNQNGEIKFTLKNDNKSLIFSITNTGDGIPQKDVPFIFERFYKVDKSRSAAKNNTGLGLYIVKTIVNAHSGTISVKTKENEFTTFKITLPIT